MRTNDIREALSNLNSLNESVSTKTTRRSFLLEDLKGYFKNQYLKAFVGDVPEGPQKQRAERDAYNKALAIAKIDPTFTGREIENPEEALKKNPGSYFDWLVRMIKKNYISYEDMIQDAHEFTDQLKIFTDLKKKNRIPADKKDIMKFKTLHDLMEMIQELGATSDDGSVSEFRQDVSNIRQALVNIVGVRDRDIPQSIQNTDDVLKFIGGNEEWDIIVPQSYWGTAILDRWGNGAGWCVGGMLGNNRGMDQIRQAENYYNHYNQGGAKYVCFQRKNKSAPRPTNKYLITLGPRGVLPETSAGYQFNDANNHTQYLGERSYGDDYQDGQMAAFAKFLQDNGLVEIFKNSEFGDCACFLDIENRERLEKGEPYKYAGGKVKSAFKDVIKTIEFEDTEGEKHVINAKEHPTALEMTTIEDMANLDNLIQGKPYVYTGGKILQAFRPEITLIEFEDPNTKAKRQVNAKENPSVLEVTEVDDLANAANIIEGKPYVYSGDRVKPAFLRPLIKEIVFVDGYNNQTTAVDREGNDRLVVGIPSMAFKGCENLEKIRIPENVLALGKGAFEGCDKVKITTPRHKMICNREDRPFYMEHMTYEGE